MGARGPLKLVPDVAAEEPQSLAEEVTPGAPEMPEGMSDAEQALWRSLVPQLDELGLVSVVDGLTLDLTFRHYLAAKKASDELKSANSVAIEDAKNERMAKHPADAVMRLHSEMFLKYATQAGMTYVARARLAARGSDDDEENPFVTSPATNTGGS